MNEKQATREYYKRAIPSIFIYIFSMVTIDYVDRNLDLSIIILYSLSLLPILATLAWMWAHWLFIQKMDEFIRMIHYKSIMFGTSIVLAIGSGWGILETLVDAPALPILQVLPIFWLSYGAAAIYVTKKINNTSYEK